MISEKTVEEYEQNGAVCIREAVSRDDVESLLAQLDHLIARQDDRWTTNRVGGFSDRHLWPSMPWMYDFCANTRLPEIAGRLMRSRNARLFFDHTFIRDAGTDHKTPWHQDRTYWPFTGRQIASVWVALTECEPDSSSLCFIKGSHKSGKVYRPQAFGKSSASAQFLNGNDAYDDMPDFDAEPDIYQVLGWDMRPGDVVVFGGEVVHGSSTNELSAMRRAAISVRYVGEDARWDPRPGTDPIVTADQVSINAGDPPHDDRWFPEVWRD